jgi:hypothetical protein
MDRSMRPRIHIGGCVFVAPAPASPRLEPLPWDAGMFQFLVTGETSRLYQVQASLDLKVWTNILSTNSLTGVFSYSDPDSLTAGRQFYRVKVGQ